MPSYNTKLKREIEKRDAAMLAFRRSLSAAAGTVGCAVDDVKENLRPSRVLNEVRENYEPAILIRKYPFSTILAAGVAGFVAAPLVRMVASAVSASPKPAPAGPQHVIIRVEGPDGTKVNHTVVGAQPAPATSTRDTLLEILGMFGGVQGLMQRFMPYIQQWMTAEKPSSPNGNSRNPKPAPTPAPVAIDPEVQAANSRPHPSISRRYAPPPKDQ